MLRLAIRLALAAPLAIPAPVIATEMPAATHQQLVSLFAEWRAFNHPRIIQGRPDYGAPAMATKAAGLSSFKQRLAGIGKGRLSARRSRDVRARLLPEGIEALVARSGLLPNDLPRNERRTRSRGSVGRAQYRPVQIQVAAEQSGRCAPHRATWRCPRAPRGREGQLGREPGPRPLGLWRPRLHGSGQGTSGPGSRHTHPQRSRRASHG